LLGHFNWGLDNVSGTKQRDIALYELGRGPVLLLLDDLEEINLDESKEIIDILSSWNTTLGGRALLIMRRQRPEFDDLIQSNWISIGELPEAAAMEFFSARLGGVDIAMARLGANFTNVFSLCYCHPKLLILTAAALQLGVPWDQLATQLKQLVGTPIAKMEQVLEITISQIQRDSPIAGQFLDCWAVFAEAAIEEAWRFVLSGKMLGVDDPVRQWQNDALETIQRATILQRFSSENGVQCRIHPLVSEYLHSHRWSILTQEKREEYQVRHLNFYRESISSRSENYPIVLEWDNILLALKNTSKTKRWKEVIALCNILVGNERELLFRKNLWNHAKLALNYAIQAAQELSEQQLLAVFLHNLGISQYRTAEYQEAEKSFEQSLTIAIQIGDIDLVIRERLEIGRVCYRLMRYEQAEEYFEKVRIQAQLKGDLGRYAAALHELGRLAYRRKNASVAQQLLGEALQIRENVSIKLGVAQTLHELGRVQHDLALEAENAKQLEDAESLYQRSLALRREVGDYVGQQATIHQLGLLSFDQGHYERAQKYYSECIELSDALNDRFWIAHNQFRYARLLWRLHEYEEAARLASQSLELCTVLGVSLKTQVENWLKAPS
jgi:tetratricopeptide (TPR) repeat protein